MKSKVHLAASSRCILLPSVRDHLLFLILYLVSTVSDHSQAPQVPIPRSMYSNWDAAIQKALSRSIPTGMGHASGNIIDTLIVSDSEIDSAVDHDNISEYSFSNLSDFEIPGPA